MLNMYLGPMYAGKTSKLIEMFNLNKDQHKVIIDFTEEGCYEGILENHNKVQQPAVKTNKLMDVHSIYKCTGNLALAHDMISVYDNDFSKHKELSIIKDSIENANSIYINEAQFFLDLYEFVLEQLNLKKHIYIYGLDGDFEQKKMGSILDLIPYCDSVCKLKSICNQCKSNAIFSKRITESKEQYLLDENAYIPLCRNCFYIL